MASKILTDDAPRNSFAFKKTSEYNERAKILLEVSVIGEAFDQLTAYLIEPDSIPKTYCREDTEDSSDGRILIKAGIREVCAVMKWAETVPFFSSIDFADQRSLLLGNFLELVIARVAYRSLKLGIEKLHFAEDFSVTQDESVKLGFLPLLSSGILNFAKKVQEIQVDDLEFHCLQCILLTYPETFEVKNCEFVRDINRKYLDVLRIHTKAAYPNTPAKHGRVLLLLPSLRTLAVKAADSYISMLLFGQSLQMEPGVLEFLRVAASHNGMKY